MKRLSITMVGTLPPIKGISEYCIELSNALSKKTNLEFINFKSIYPEFLYPGGTKEKGISKINFVDKKIKIKNILYWYHPLSWIKAGLTAEGEIIHINWWASVLFPIFFTIALINKFKRKKIVLTLHNITAHESSKIDIIFSKIMFHIADHLIVHSKNNKEILIKIFNITPDKVSIIPYGPLNFYKTVKLPKSKNRRFLKLNENHKVILFFGTIRPYKGLKTLILALQQVVKDIPKVKLIIAGKNWERWKPYEKLIDQLDLSNNIDTYLEYIPTSKVPYFFNAADLVVLPYEKFDSQSGVGELAIAFHKALIVSNTGSLPTLVKDNKVIFEKRDYASLSKKIIAVLSNKNIRKTLESHSKEISYINSWEKSTKEIVNLYNTLLK